MRPNDADGLQKGVDCSSADKFHAAPSQVDRDGIGQWRRGDAALDYGLEVAEMPNVAVERAKFLLNFDENLRVMHGCSDFLPIAHNGGIVAESVDFCVVVSGYGGAVKPIERTPESLAFVQNALPRQSRHETLQYKPLEKQSIVMHRHAPFVVVICHIERISQIAPIAARRLFFGNHAAKIQKNALGNQAQIFKVRR